LKNNEFNITSDCLHDTQEIGSFLGNSSGSGFNYFLTGNLGSGKTCLTQGILKGLGYDGYVHSPTFVLMTEYECRLPIYHIDLYRLTDQGQIDDLMLDEQLESGENVNIIEWADKSAYLNNIPHIKIDLKSTKHNSRILNISTDFEMYYEVINSMQHLELECKGKCE
tara:strand:+ start:565 stop:1065 length:501 start_codon:yes stop_codon:yes gene_type:complete